MGGCPNHSGQTHFVPPEPIPRDYDVTGDLTPDATGYYDEAGIYAGKPYYIRHDGAYKIWWNIVGFWVISLDLDVMLPGCWARMDPAIEGDYTVAPPWTGVATVSTP